MILQQGRLWIQEELNGKSIGNFVERYVFLIPFCGALWLDYEPDLKQLDLNELVANNEKVGWICGGNINPVLVTANGPSFVDTLFSFRLIVESAGFAKELVFCCEDEDVGAVWINNFNCLLNTLIFVRCCVENDQLPSPELYQQLQRISTQRVLSISHSLISVRTMLVTKSFMTALSLESITKLEFHDVQLNDGHVPMLVTLLRASATTLEELNLSQNQLTSKGIKALASGLLLCSQLKLLDLSSNVISDSSTKSLMDAIQNIPSLEHFSIANNRLTAHSMKALATTFREQKWQLRSLDLSYNELGDDLGFMIAFLLHNLSASLSCVNVSFCGLSELSLREIIKHIPHCPALTVLNLQGIVFSAETGQNLARAISRHHQLYRNTQSRLVVYFGGIVTSIVGNVSITSQSLRSCCLELTDITELKQIVLRRESDLEKVAPLFGCLRIETQPWLSNSRDFFYLLLNTFGDSRLTLTCDTRPSSVSDSETLQSWFLFFTAQSPSLLKTATNDSHPVFRRLNVKSVFLQCRVEGEEERPRVESKFIEASSYGGRGSLDQYIPPIAPTDQYYQCMAVNEDQARDSDLSLFVLDSLPSLTDGLEEEEVEEDHKSDSHDSDEEDLNGDHDFRNLLAYENSLREKRQINERLILAARRLYQTKEVSSSTAKFWEGMLGNTKYKKFAEKELVMAMSNGHEAFPDDSSRDLGLLHLFPAVARREQLYQAMYSRDVDQLRHLQPFLTALTGGYALVYSTRLVTEILSIRQQFENLSLLALSYSELPLIEEFLLYCGKLAYTGEEMFRAAELRDKLFAAGLKRGDASFQEMVPAIKARAVLTNLMISRDFQALRGKVSEWKTRGDFDLASLPELAQAEALLQEYDQCLANIKTATEKREIDLIDLSLAIASYWNFFSPAVDNCLATLNDISRNPATLIRPIVEGLRKGKMGQVDRGFENLFKMGLVHEALDSVVCSKIHAIKSRIIQDDSVKDKLVKVCLALKNGFHVAPGEIMQLYRKAAALKLQKDSSLKGYFKILQRYSKKFNSLQKQEEAIQRMIASNDVFKLSKLLAGRGTGKLVMSFPTSFARDQWLAKFQLVCSGHAIGGDLTRLEAKDFQEEVVFQGSFEKAARSTDGKLRGWRKRFFVLRSVHLLYFTKLNGEKKGSIRVLNGGVRVMDSGETGGKQFCLELEEGRDLSCVSPDLLEEARRHVRFAKIMEIESSLRRGLALKSISLLSQMLKFAEDLEVMLDYRLMNDAKTCLQRLQIQDLRKSLYFSAFTIPRSQTLQELSDLANKFLLDPNLVSLKRIRSLLNKSEIEQEIYRCKSSLLFSRYSDFMRSVRTLSKVDFSQTSSKLKSFYISLILQFVGMRAIDVMFSGPPFLAVVKYLKLALSFCHSYHIELEVMDLIRFVLRTAALHSLDTGVSSSPESPPLGGTTALPGDLLSLLEEMYHFPRPPAQYSIGKFQFLRLSSVQSQAGLFSSFQRRKSSALTEMMTHSSTAIVKSLLKYEVKPLDNAIAVEAFKVLQSIMGDLPMSFFKRWKHSKILQSPPSLPSLVYDLLDLLLKRYPAMQDEVYFQLCKQLKLNPDSHSRLKGCWLLSLYLHCFVPTVDAFPFVKTHIHQLLLEVSQSISVTDSTAAITPCLSREETPDSLCREVLVYCYWLVSQAEFFQFSSSQPFLLSDSLPLQQTLRSEHDPAFVKRMIEFIFLDDTFEFHVILLTGEVITLRLHYSQLTYQHLLVELYNHLLPPSMRSCYLQLQSSHSQSREESDGLETSLIFKDLPRTAEKVSDQEGLSSLSTLTTGENWKDILLLFTGFSFFRVTPEELVSPPTNSTRGGEDWSVSEENKREEARLALDLMAVPIQPIHSHSLSFDQDLQWKFLSEHFQHSKRFEEEEAMAPHNSLIVRRMVSRSFELFADSEYEIFGEEIQENDQIQRAAAWKSWLKSPSHWQEETSPEDPIPTPAELALLPRDFVRVDLQFSEDTRYVNSRLALMSDDSFAYLVALQLSLAWCSEPVDRPEKRFLHCSSSVASCYHFQSFDSLRQDLQTKYDRLVAARNQVKPVDNNVSNADDNSSDDDDLAAIDQHNLSTIHYQVRGEDDDSSEYQSSEETEEETQTVWRPLPISVGQKLGEEEKSFLLSLLEELGISGFDEEEEDSKEVEEVDSAASSRGLSLQKLWSLMASFHRLALELEIPLTSCRYRYYLKRAYHHYLVTVTGLFYEQHLTNARLVGLELEETIADRHLDFQSRVIDSFRPMEVLIGLSPQGLYLLAPSDWSVVFYSPFWDVTEFELERVPSDRTRRERLRLRLVVNVNGLRLSLEGDKVSEVIDLMAAFSKEALAVGSFPFGTRPVMNELQVINAYHELHQPQVKVNSAASFSSSSSMLAQNTTNTRGNHLFQLFLANYSLLPLPPTIDNRAFLRHSKFFVAPPSQREIIANTRYEEEKLEEEIMKLAEQVLLEKNQQQITKGRNEFVNRSNQMDEEDEFDDGEGLADSDNPSADKLSSNHNRNLKLKRKNRSVFQGNRLKSSEEINQMVAKDRLEASVCGVSTRDSIFTQQVTLPPLPYRIKGKVKVPSEAVGELSETEKAISPLDTRISSSLLNKPVIESQRLLETSPPSTMMTLMWTLPPPETSLKPSDMLKHDHETDVWEEKRSELLDLWKATARDFSVLRADREKDNNSDNRLKLDLLETTAIDTAYERGLSYSLWSHHQTASTSNLGVSMAVSSNPIGSEGGGLDDSYLLHQLDETKDELEI